MTMQHVLNEFPDYDAEDLPALAASIGWSICAWHNDNMPYLQHPQDKNDRWRIWCDYAAPAMREWQEGKRFIVARTEWLSNGGAEYDELLTTDEWSEVVEFVNKEIKL